VRDGDEMTLYLLCRTCSSGDRFRSDSILDGWRVLEERTFEFETDYSDRDDDRFRYGSEEDDLAIDDVRRSIDYDRDEVIVELEITVSNEGDRTNILEELRYDIEVDNDRLSSRDYDIDHVRTECEDRGINRNDDEDVRIDRNDECTFEVEITLDRDEVEDEIVEIEILADATRDDRSSNNRDTVRFRAR
jgi:hypothetical protein